MARIQYFPGSEEYVPGPAGKPSFPRSEFTARFQPWLPDWDKPVTVGKTISYEELPLANALYADGTPSNFTNDATVLLFEEANSYVLIKTDYFTRLLFSEQSLLKKPFMLPGFGVLTMTNVLKERREPSDNFWSAAGLPGIPIAIGVNGSIRDDTGTELLAYKKKGAAGGMGETLGPPVSAAAVLEWREQNQPSTLGVLVDAAFLAACERELPDLPIPVFRRRRAWLDADRGFKPEINFACSIPSGRLADYQGKVQRTHAGVVVLDNHLDAQGKLTPTAEQMLSTWGLNFQAWFLWEQSK